MISVDRIFELYSEHVTTMPAPAKARECIEGAVGGVKMALHYDGHTDDVLMFAAMLLYKIVRLHCFTDGNKRVGFTSCLHILSENGLIITSSDQEVIDTVESAAAGTLSLQELLDWLSKSIAAQEALTH